MVEVIYTIVPAIVTAVVGWFLARRKYRAEAKANELDNVDKAIKIWRELSTELEMRLKNEITALREENDMLKTKLRELKCENEKMHKELVSLRNFAQDVARDNEVFMKQLRRNKKDA